MVCSPEKETHWTDTEFVLRKIVHPVFHGISIIILLFVAIIYFILPSLRYDSPAIFKTTKQFSTILKFKLQRSGGQYRDDDDLLFDCEPWRQSPAHFHRTPKSSQFFDHRYAPNLCLGRDSVHQLCLMFSDMVAHISMIAVFFWVSSLGYYIWKTFRSRNVFLKFTDGTKYCWYSFYAWGSTTCMSSLGVFAHFFLDITAPKKILLFEEEPETVGILALLIFYITITIVVAANIYFFISTRNYLNSRMNASYGRIHYKLKSKWVTDGHSTRCRRLMMEYSFYRFSFIMFSLLLCMLTITWILSIFSWFDSEGMFYNLTISAIQAPLLLYICVLRQEHITYLLKKSCCSKQPLSAADWGDEMTYINTANR